MKNFFLLMTVVAFLTPLALVTETSAQMWDNKWFKFKGKARGYVVKENGKLARASFKGSSYVLFEWNTPNQRYDLTHWVQEEDDTWVSFTGILPAPIGNEEVLWRDIYTRLQKGDDWIWVYAVTRVRINYNPMGSIEHARFKSMGCESPMGLIGGEQFGGKCRLRGKMVDPEDLPFAP